MQKHSLQMRIWHWAFALVICVSILTALLAETYLGGHSNASVIVSELAKSGIIVSNKDALIAAEAIKEPMFEWHIYFGYAFASLLLWRIIIIAIYGFGFSSSTNHMKWVHRLYKLIYCIFILSAITGLLIHFSGSFNIGDSILDPMKDVHQYLGWCIMGFVVLHIAGVFIAENQDQKGIASGMISG